MAEPEPGAGPGLDDCQAVADLMFSVIFRVETCQKRKRDVRDSWVPQTIWPLMEYGGCEPSDINGPNSRWYDHVWQGILSPSQLRMILESVYDDGYMGQQGGMAGATGFDCLIPDMRWQSGLDEQRYLSICPFPAVLDTDAKRYAWDFAEWDALKDRVEKWLGLADPYAGKGERDEQSTGDG